MTIGPAAPSESTTVRLPPGPKLPPLVQSVWYMNGPRSFIERYRAAYGDLFTMRSLNGTVVMGCTPAHAKQVFSASPDTFEAFGTDAVAPILGKHSMLLVSGEEHRKQRRLLQPPFHGERMRAYGAIMRDVALDVFANVSAGTLVRANDLTATISLEIILRAVFGLQGAPLHEGRRIVGQLLEGASPWLLFSPVVQHPAFPPWRKLQSARSNFATFVEQVVMSRQASGHEGEDILSLILSAKWDDGSSLSLAEVRDQLLTLLMAGHETTAIGLAWAIHDVYRDQTTLHRLRNEIASLGSSPAPDALAKLPLLTSVCDETLRLRPIVTDVVRKVVRPFEYDGYLVPIGAAVGVSIDAIHSDGNLYPSPEAFQPDRFIKGRPGPFDYLPFGGGHRRCIGSAFADYEARIILGTTLANFDIEPAVADQRVRRNITMGPRKGVPIRVRKRAS